MNLPRIFANAIARRIAYVVVAALLAWAGFGSAKAQTQPDFSKCADRTVPQALCPSVSAAISAMNSIMAQYCAAGNFSACPEEVYTPARCVPFDTENTTHDCNMAFSWRTASGSGGDSTIHRLVAKTSCPAGQQWNVHTSQCQPPCSGRPSSVQPFLPLSGSKQCFNGCVVSYMQNGDDTTSTRSYSGAMCGNDQFKQECGAGFFWNGYMGVCQPVQPDCPDGQVDQGGQCKPENQCPDGMIAVPGTTPGAIQSGALNCKPSEDTCPAGQIRSPSGQCLPGEGQCAAGEARRKDGTCGRDADGDGVADVDDDDDTNDGGKESFSGGDSCTAPPSCSGGPIDCGMARIQWRIDCNTRTKVNVTGGTCNAVPQCVGENCRAMEYAQLLQQWRATCALEKIAKGEGGEGGAVGDANKNGVADVLEGRLAQGEPGGDGETNVRSLGVSTSLLDTDNIFGGGSCPQPPSFELMGKTISGSDFPYWCQAMSILRALVLIFGAYTALRILLGGGI